LAKDTYHATNSKDEYLQMTAWLDCQEKVFLHNKYINQHPTASESTTSNTHLICLLLFILERSKCLPGHRHVVSFSMILQTCMVHLISKVLCLASSFIFKVPTHLVARWNLLLTIFTFLSTKFQFIITSNLSHKIHTVLILQQLL